MFQYFSASCLHKLVWIGGMSYNNTIYMFDNGTKSGFTPTKPDLKLATFKPVNWDYYNDHTIPYCISQGWIYWRLEYCFSRLCGLCKKAPPN